MEVCRRRMEECPRTHAATIRRNGRRLLSFGAHEGSADPRIASMVEVVKTFNFGRAKAVPFLAWGMAHVADLMKAGRHDGAESFTLTLLMAVEQSTLDNGRWSLAWLLTHLPVPPWTSIAANPPPDPLRPFGQLAEPQWTTVAMAYAKDAAALSEIRKKMGGGKGEGRGNDREEK